MIKDVDLSLKRPATLPFEKLEKLLVVIGELHICPRPATLPFINQVTMVGCCVFLVLFVMFMTVFMKINGVILRVMLEDVEVYLKRSATLP